MAKLNFSAKPLSGKIVRYIRVPGSGRRTGGRAATGDIPMRKSILRGTAALALALCAASGAFAAPLGELPDFGTAGVRGITVEKEREMGKSFLTVARSQLPVIYDPVMNQYLNALVSRMAPHADGVAYPFEVLLVEDKTINAAAFFGGKILLHTGLIAATDSESQLASVLAHEMTHVSQRHIARSIEAQRDAMYAGAAGILGSLILAVINPAAGMAGVTASLGGVRQSAINYTRSNEYEADRLGIDLLYRSGFNPNGMADMMRKLQVRGEDFNPAFEMLLTHPLTSKRVAEAENRARSFPAKKYYESADFRFARSRVLARYSTNTPEYNYGLAAGVLARSPRDPEALYLSALACLALKRYGEAEKALGELSRDYGRNLFVIDTLTDLYTARKEYGRAAALLEAQIEGKGMLETLAVNLANVRIESGAYEQAVQLLKKFRRNGFSVPADELLKTAYLKQRKTCELYQINSDILEYRGQWEQALYNVSEAMRVCTEKNTLLRLKALASRIASERDFYERLLKN